MSFDYSPYTCIFFMHIPKCAGTFFKKNLEKQKEICFEYAGHEGWDNYGNPLDLNVEIRTKLCNELNSSTKKTLKIATVRNPFDLLVSLYFHGGDNPARGFMNVQSSMKLKSFEDFVIWYCDPNSSYDWQFDDFLFQRIFSTDMKCFPDVLIRFECLTNGIQKICKNLNMEMLDLQKDEKTTNASNNRKFITQLGKDGKNYRKLYSAKAREAVESMCYRELDMFGYDFYGPTDNRDLIYPSLDKKFDQVYNKLLFNLWPLYKKSN